MYLVIALLDMVGIAKFLYRNTRLVFGQTSHDKTLWFAVHSALEHSVAEGEAGYPLNRFTAPVILNY